MIDLTRRNDAEYMIRTGISFNPKAVREATVRAYGISYGLVSTDDALARFLLSRVNDRQSISAAFDVPVSKDSKAAIEAMAATGNDNPQGKQFQETFVGSLLALLFPPEVAPVPPNTLPPQGNAIPFTTTDILWIVGGIVVGIILIIAAVRLIKK